MINFIKKTVRKYGIEITKFTPDRSADARIQRLFAYHTIDLVLDVGANVGIYAKHLRKIGYKGRIVSFEPISSAYAQLLSANKKDPLWEIATRAAIGHVDGEIKINISNNSESSSVLNMLESHKTFAPDSVYIDSEIVKIHKLDTIASRYIRADTRSVYLKMDVQGFEMRVLEGAVATLPKIRGIQMELSLTPLYEGETLFKEMLNTMERIGYDLYAVMPVFSDVKTGRLLQLDSIFFRHE